MDTLRSLTKKKKGKEERKDSFVPSTTPCYGIYQIKLDNSKVGLFIFITLI
jgi:hypothetical protein